MKDILIAVAKVSKIEETGDEKQIQTTLKIVKQNMQVEKAKLNVTEIIVKGQLEFGRNYELTLKEGILSNDLFTPTRKIREVEDEDVD